MRHLAAYILLVVGGNATPSAEDVTALLAKAGVEVDAERLTTLLTELEVSNKFIVFTPYMQSIHLDKIKPFPFRS